MSYLLSLLENLYNAVHARLRYISMHSCIPQFITIAWLLYMPHVYANNYELQDEMDSIIGQIDSVIVDNSTTLLDVARLYGFGFTDIKLLNPEVDTWMPNNGQTIHLPAKFIIPDVLREGIVLNIPEMRMYYFPPRVHGQSVRVVTYPLGVGREGWETPYEKTHIVGKKKFPDWRPTASIRKEHAEAGDPLPALVPAGEDNPLGDYALRLALPTYLIHGTNKPWGVGMRVSHGCLRLYPEDIAELFYQVDLGTKVNIINEPYKVGQADGLLYLEVHPPLDAESADMVDGGMSHAIRVIMSTVHKKEGEYIIDWDIVRVVVNDAIGIPIAIGQYID